MGRRSDGAFHILGLGMGVANNIRHRRIGYVAPRPFDAAEIDRTIEHTTSIVDRLEERGEIVWDGRRVLEIGPGSDLATGAIMLHRGARSYHAVDLFDNRSQRHADLYRHLGLVLGHPIDEDRLGFTQTEFPELPGLEGEYDVIVSNACLEHIAEPGLLLKRLRRLAAPAARMVHHIDGQTHMRWIKDRDPLNILRYSDVVYRGLLDFPGAPNRWRADDFQAAAFAAGFDARVVPGRQAAHTPRVARRFRGRNDLGVLTFTLVADAR